MNNNLQLNNNKNHNNYKFKIINLNQINLKVMEAMNGMVIGIIVLNNLILLLGMDWNHRLNHKKLIVPNRNNNNKTY